MIPGWGVTYIFYRRKGVSGVHVQSVVGIPHESRFEECSPLMMCI